MNLVPLHSTILTMPERRFHPHRYALKKVVDMLLKSIKDIYEQIAEFLELLVARARRLRLSRRVLSSLKER